MNLQESIRNDLNMINEVNDMTVKTQIRNFLNDLNENCNHIVDIENGDCTSIWSKFCESQITISLGNGWAGHYEGGYWGDCSIDDDKLLITFSVGDIYEDGDFNIGEGRVFGEGHRLRYSADNKGMAYTSELDKKVGQALRRVTNGMLTCEGSEHGMQEDTYLSVDVEQMGY